MQQGKVYISKEKQEELQQELESLTTVKRREIAEQLEYAKGLGDLSENAEYHEARDSQGKLESRIAQIEEILKNAEILTHHKGSTIDVGSTVTLQRAKETDTNTYDIVGPEEFDMATGKLSYESPLGRALIGKKKGEEFSFDTPKGKVNYKIVNVK